MLRLAGPGFPWGTLFVNIFGSLLMGLLIGWLVKRTGVGVVSSENLRLFLATGLLGGFTTFSAFSLDVANMWQRGDTMAAFSYILASVLFSILAVFAGLWLVRSIA